MFMDNSVNPFISAKRILGKKYNDEVVIKVTTIVEYNLQISF